MRYIALFVLVLAAGLLGQACGGKQARSAGAGEISAAGLTPAQEAMKDRALAARDELFRQLGGRLAVAVSESGPASAITVCAEEAPEIAAAVSREHGLTIGRTSFRLRNPANRAPAWAEPLVAGRVEEDVVQPAPDGGLQVLSPIRTKSLCLMCHGDKDAIAPDVQEALSENYPGDQATGFAAGDLRGWYWIEVPATSP